MTDPFRLPGHGPADPEGYLVEEVSDGYRWTRRADGCTAGPFPSREDAVGSAAVDADPDTDPEADPDTDRTA